MNNDICWYHGKITREQTETLLKNGGQNGLFLVRDSNTSKGDYVLSVLHGDEVNHYQIRTHAEDAFFSIGDTLKFHGLEVLIEHYFENELTDKVVLSDFVKGEAPPHETRRYGQTNLLHRATCQGDLYIVTELLKTGYNHETKNDLGQTAVHIASISGENDILLKLIEFKANVNLRDTSGQTALHYACQNNLPATVRLLVQTGHANIQARNSDNDNVPLHDASCRGFKDVVQELLSLNAPVRPRNKDKKTPAQLAKMNGHYDCANILDNYKAPPPRTEKHKWFHGTLSRQEAEQLIKDYNYQSGTYLIRYSERNKGTVLTLVNNEQFFNYIIRYENGYLFIDDGPYLDSLEHIVDYYTYLPDGLPTTLETPVPPRPKPPVPFDTMPRPKKSKSPAKPENDTVNSVKSISSQLKDIKFTSNFNIVNNFNNNNSTNINHNSNNNSESDDYIPLESIKTGNIIGEGEFGSVYQGTYTNKNGKTIRVAIKTLHDEQVESNKGAFLSEAQVMMKLNHNCIVKLIGLSPGPPLLMVQELVELGSILNYMETNREKARPNYEFKIWATQIACGMKYLEEQRFVHRDLAARNILLATPVQIKISDFGLSRALDNEAEYRAVNGGKWPLKWYAPESYNFGQFSHKSDVWSFGITIWEMYSFGAPPYGELKGVEAITLIDAGERLSKPESCPNHIYDIMLKCWDSDADKRPTFSELVTFFESEPDYMNVRELLLEGNNFL